MLFKIELTGQSKMDFLIKNLLLMLYLAAMGVYLLFFFSYKGYQARLARLILVGLLILHLVSIIISSLVSGRAPLSSLSEALSVSAWCVGAMYLVVEILSGRAELGGFVIGLASVFQLLSILYPASPEPPPILDNPGFVLHAWLSLLAYSGIFLNFLFAVLFVVMRREIKNHKLGRIFERLPSIQTLDLMSSHAATVGLVLLTAGLIAGSIWAKIQWGSFFAVDPKLIASVVVWLIYGVYVLARALKIESPRFFVALSLIGFCAVLFSFILVHGLSESIHRF